MVFTDRVIQIAFLLVPFGFLSLGGLYEGHQFALIFAAIAILGAQVRDRWLRVLVLYACLWGLWLFISYMTTDDIFSRAKAFGLAKRGQVDMLWIMVAVSIYLGVARRGGRPVEGFYHWICAGAIVQMVIAVIQSAGFNPVVWFCNTAFPTFNGTTHQTGVKATDMTGTLYCVNFLAAQVAISVPFFLYKWWHIPKTSRTVLVLRVCSIALAVIVLYGTKTTTAVAALIIGVWVYYSDEKQHFRWPWLTLNRAVLFLGFVLGSLYVLVVDIPFWTDTVRWPAWSLAFKAVTDSWPKAILGLGPGASSTWGFTAPMHNEWLTVWHYYGLIGLALAVGCVVRGILVASKPLRASLATACVNMLGNHAIHLAPSVFLIIIVLGLIERERWQTS